MRAIKLESMLGMCSGSSVVVCGCWFFLQDRWSFPSRGPGVHSWPYLANPAGGSVLGPQDETVVLCQEITGPSWWC